MRRGRRAGTALAGAVVASLLVTMAGGLLGGCARTAAPRPSAADLEGAWVLQQNDGVRAALSDLTLKSDGTFTHSGLNALGGKVTFAGTWEVASVQDGDQIRLRYDNYPQAPKNWYFKIAGEKLVLAASAADLSNGPAMVFTRVRFSERGRLGADRLFGREALAPTRRTRECRRV